MGHICLISPWGQSWERVFPQLVGAVEYLDKSFLGRTLFWQHKMTANIILGWVIIPGSIEHYGRCHNVTIYILFWANERRRSISVRASKLSQSLAKLVSTQWMKSFDFSLIPTNFTIL